MRLSLSLAALTLMSCITPTASVMATSSATTTTTGSESVYATTNTSVTDQVNAYSTTLIAQIQGGPPLVDRTLTVSANSPLFQSAISAAEATLTSDGATSLVGPTLTSSVNSLSTSTQTVQTGQTSSLSFASTVIIGPATIYTGTNLDYPFVVAAGSEDINTVVTDHIDTFTTTTTTVTDLLSQVYDISARSGGGGSGTGFKAPEMDPACAASGLTLLIGGLAVLRGRRRGGRAEQATR